MFSGTQKQEELGKKSAQGLLSLFYLFSPPKPSCSPSLLHQFLKSQPRGERGQSIGSTRSSPQRLLRISPLIQPTKREMALSPMWTGMLLLGTMRDHLQDSEPVLSKIPLQLDFQAKKFQGKWYVIGLAGRNITTEGPSHYKMYATVYQLQADHSYRVISNLIKGESCDIGLRTFVPQGKPGQFALDNFKAYGVTKYVFRVVKTNYDEFAILYFHSAQNNKVNFMVSLYGRTKELKSEPKEKFIEFAQSLGLTGEFLLFLPKDEKCINDET
ncbi:neutrophil gelatinase-associated lipocalin-like isoform X2 [Dromiciops gliroides]|uniref:neutrophil gelatinase-associated lipocalin-like isoform X2 n=1 Tax=Dromiciops gliroides TaxID=33562 RepID=UPI001CC5A1EE|nr:neutrophil gelatinase-associated lipocalin-like isoform X2 [Dromiciops gliroides]XP_043844937.1 neutrophil gelatinase-associated lipocalin-like isoform X2 [Dromiciops gliroides]XP_043844938.1 neutrophil gelatinase-associated lipocalin-like isoform X2 [Dromiciops gliroides]